MVSADFLKARLTPCNLFRERSHLSLSLTEVVKFLKRVQKCLFMVFYALFGQGLQIVDCLLRIFTGRKRGLNGDIWP